MYCVVYRLDLKETVMYVTDKSFSYLAYNLKGLLFTSIHHTLKAYSKDKLM